MKEFINKYKSKLFVFVAVWVYLSILLSATWGNDTCGRDYPIKYILYSDLFCEIKEGVILNETTK